MFAIRLNGCCYIVNECVTSDFCPRNIHITNCQSSELTLFSFEHAPRRGFMN